VDLSTPPLRSIPFTAPVKNTQKIKDALCSYLEKNDLDLFTTNPFAMKLCQVPSLFSQKTPLSNKQTKISSVPLVLKVLVPNSANVLTF
jgi:hypothetical protein